MRGGLEGLDAYKGIPYGSDLNDGGICPSTAGQIGWRVTRNGLPDVVDTTPTITVNPPVSTGNPSTLTVAGSAREVAWPPGHNAKGRAFAKGISIFVPHDFQYSVDGGSPVTINPAGSGATRTFSVTVDTSALGAGPDAGAPTRHVIAVQATTGTPATKNVVAWAAPTPVTLTLKSAAATIALGGKASLTVHAADTNDALQTTYPIGHLAGVSVGPRGGVAASRKTVTTGAAGNAAATFTPSFTTTYAATFTPGPSSREFTAATPALVTVAVRARLTASAAAPTAARVVRVAGTCGRVAPAWRSPCRRCAAACGRPWPARAPPLAPLSASCTRPLPAHSAFGCASPVTRATPPRSRRCRPSRCRKLARLPLRRRSPRPLG